MKIQPIIEGKNELINGRVVPKPIVLSSRVRLARNLENFPFPGWANEENRNEVLALCMQAVKGLSEMEGSHSYDFKEITELEKRILMERYLISAEHFEARKGAGVVISENQSYSIMINEEDHFRVQVVNAGYNLKSVWKKIDAIDTGIEKTLDFAFSPELGYLTACPTNLGTGLRASVMMHLPGLVITEQMEKVIRAANQLGLAVRGVFGEGSDANGSIFQISNQQTLGESEMGIIERLSGVLNTVIEQEINARKRLVKTKAIGLFDKIGRAYGIICNAHSVASAEAMNFLSLMRLGVDLKIIPEKYRKMIDRLFIEIQPGHIQVASDKDISPQERDAFRASILSHKFKNISGLNFENVQV